MLKLIGPAQLILLPRTRQAVRIWVLHTTLSAIFRKTGKDECGLLRKINVPFDGIRDIFQQPGENIVWIGTTTLASYNKSTGQWAQWPSGPGYYDGFAMAPKLTTEPILWMYPIGKAIFYGFNLKEKNLLTKFQPIKCPQTCSVAAMWSAYMLISIVISGLVERKACSSFFATKKKKISGENYQLVISTIPELKVIH